MPISFLTRDGYQKLQEELEDLRTHKRLEIANRLHEAMEGGELIENAEYEAAKERQRYLDARISMLKKRVAEGTQKDKNVEAVPPMPQLDNLKLLRSLEVVKFLLLNTQLCTLLHHRGGGLTVGVG